MSKRISFLDGFTSETQPEALILLASSIVQYLSDAAYVSAKGSAASEGDIYYNTTSDVIKFYNGTAWVELKDADKLKGVEIDDTDKAEGLALKYDSASNTLKYGEASGGEGSSFGLALDELPYRIGFKDTFSDENLIDSSETTATYDGTNKAFTISYDAGKTATTIDTALALSAAPSFTIQVGDLIISTISGNKEIREITALGSINVDGGLTTAATLDSAFSVGRSADPCILSQKVQTEDGMHYYDSTDPESRPSSELVGHILLSNKAVNDFDHAEQPEWLTPQVNDIILQYTGGVLYESYITVINSTTNFTVNSAANLNNGAAFIIRPSQMASYLVDYRDDGFVDSVNVAFAAITDADATSAWADEYALTRNLNAADENPTRNIVGTTGAHFFLRFFANKSSGSGTVTLYEYDSAMYEEPQFNNSGVHNQAYGRTDGAGTEINCVVSTPSNTRITLADDFPSFVSGVNSGNPFGDLIVHLDGQEIPRYVDASLTPNASYVEDPNGLFITLDSDYSGSSLSVSIVRRVGSIDTSSQNTTEISKLNNFTVQVQNAAYNIDSDDDLIIVSGITTVTLPDPLLRRKPLYIKRNDAANTTTIARNSGENIDGAASDVTITTDLETVALVSDGTDWWVL